MVAIVGHIITTEEIERLTQVEKRLESTLAERDNLQQKLTDANRSIARSVSQIQALESDLANRAPAPQKITRTSLPRLAGFTLENSDKAPSRDRYAAACRALDWGARMGLDTFRIFLNPTEMRDHALGTGTLWDLVAYARGKGTRYLADTMDTITLSLKDPELKLYCDYAASLGCEGFYINDADRKDIPLDMLKSIVVRLRKAAPDMPIFASLLGSANLETYRAIVDYVEIQTFGTPGELATFLRKDAVMCLDLRKTLNASDLKTRAELALKTPPKAFFLYADLATDYEGMPADENAVIRDFVKAWKAL